MLVTRQSPPDGIARIVEASDAEAAKRGFEEQPVPRPGELTLEVGAMMNEVVLDPGHGGMERRGNSSPDGARFGAGQLEKQINFALAQNIDYHIGPRRRT